MVEDDKWTVASAEDEGKLVLFRIRQNEPAFAATRKAFPVLLAVSWRFDSDDDSGMPSEDELARMTEFEDLLSEALESREDAFLTVIATGNGVREWQWYARDPKRAMRTVNEALADAEPFPVEFSVQDDPIWEAWDAFRVTE